MSTKNNGEGAPLAQPEEGKTGEKKKELPRFAVVPHRGKGRVLGYDGEGYFLVKIPKKPPILAHRRDLTFTNTGDIKPEPKAKGELKAKAKEVPEIPGVPKEAKPPKKFVTKGHAKPHRRRAKRQEKWDPKVKEPTPKKQKPPQAEPA